MNKLCFIRDQYETESQLWASVAAFLRILSQTQQVAMIKDEGVCVVVEYDHADEELAEMLPLWVSPEVYDQIEEMQEDFDVELGD